MNSHTSCSFWFSCPLLDKLILAPQYLKPDWLPAVVADPAKPRGIMKAWNTWIVSSLVSDMQDPGKPKDLMKVWSTWIVSWLVSDMRDPGKPKDLMKACNAWIVNSLVSDMRDPSKPKDLMKACNAWIVSSLVSISDMQLASFNIYNEIYASQYISWVNIFGQGV